MERELFDFSDWTNDEDEKISDLALASYLCVIGHRIISTEPAGNKIIFLFERSNSLEADILAFYNRMARVDPLSFAETMRNLKALVLRS
jgi:hypothetical protein